MTIRPKFYFIAPRISLELTSEESGRISRWYSAQQKLRNCLIAEWQVKTGNQLAEPDTSLHSPHFGLLTLAGILSEQGYAVEYIDQEWLEKTDKWNAKLSEITLNAIAIFIGSITVSYPNAVELIQYLKGVTNAVIILGGHHVTFLDKEAIEDGADIVIRGEGESAVLAVAHEILSGRQQWKNIPNATFISNGSFVRTSHKVGKKRLLSSFHFELLNPEQLKCQEIYVFPSRGCLNSCSFCIEGGKYWNGHHMLPFSLIRETLVRYRSLLPYNFIYLYDSNFGENKNWAIELCKILCNEFPDLWFKTLIKLELLDEELLVAMKNAGIIEILVGIESGDESIRGLSGKSITNQMVLEKLELAKQYIPFEQLMNRQAFS